MNATWTSRSLALAALLCLFAAATAQQPRPEKDQHVADSATTRAREKQDGRRERNPKDERGGRSDRRRYNPEEFRKKLQVELTNIPRLNSRMDRLMTIQAERYTLQAQRRMVATDQGADRAVTVKKFHELLRRDLELSDESRRIVQQIIKDMPVIQLEMDARRADVQKQLEAENSQNSDAISSSSKASDLSRSQRYLDFLEQKLKDLETHPERMDLLSRMLRGIPMEEGRSHTHYPKKDASPEDKLESLKQKRRHLQRQLHQVEEDIAGLREHGVADGKSSNTKTTRTKGMKKPQNDR